MLEDKQPGLINTSCLMSMARKWAKYHPPPFPLVLGGAGDTCWEVDEGYVRVCVRVDVRACVSFWLYICLFLCSCVCRVRV